MTGTEIAKIQDYAIIGDCRGAALISRNGSLDWLCWPRFDSPAFFAAILDRAQGGRWKIAPASPQRIERHYVENTNVLETRFRCPSGTALLTDLMPVSSEEHKRRELIPDHEILRQVECTEGEVEVHMDFRPRADYGRVPAKIRTSPTLGLRMEVGRGVYWLRSTHALSVSEGAAFIRVQLRAGEAAQFSLSYAEDAPAVLCCLGEKARERIRISMD